MKQIDTFSKEQMSGTSLFASALSVMNVPGHLVEGADSCEVWEGDSNETGISSCEYRFHKNGVHIGTHQINS